MPWKTITRQELYDEVWSMAVSKLAPKYNLSEVGFAKFCKRCDIPRPPRGYWAKLEAGKKVKKIQRVENCLNSIVADVLEVAVKKREHEIKLEQQAIQKAEDEKRRRQEAKERVELPASSPIAAGPYSD